MQERRNSIANALELRLSCTNPSRWSHFEDILPLPVQHVINKNWIADCWSSLWTCFSWLSGADTTWYCPVLGKAGMCILSISTCLHSVGPLSWKWCWWRYWTVPGFHHHWNLNGVLAYLSPLTETRGLFQYEEAFLHDRPWISPWIKSIFNEFDITCHMLASQLSGHCDVIFNWLWCHQQNVIKASEWDTGMICEDRHFYHHLWIRYFV